MYGSVAVLPSAQIGGAAVAPAPAAEAAASRSAAFFFAAIVVAVAFAEEEGGDHIGFTAPALAALHAREQRPGA